MPAVLVTGPTVTQDSPSFPSGGWRHSQYSFLPTCGGMAQADSTWVPGSVPRWFTCPKKVTHLGTNQAQCRVTTLID